MNPKKSRELNPQVAEETGIPLHIVEAITKMYWKEVWQNVTNLSSPKVHVENLGDFNIKHWLLDKEIQKSKNYKAAGKNKYISGVDNDRRIDLLYNIQSQLEEENQRKEFIYEHKKITKESETDLG